MTASSEDGTTPHGRWRRELGTLLWLQGRLLRNGLLRGDTRSRSRLLVTGLVLLGALPTMLAGTIGQLAFLRARPAAAALVPLSVGLSLLRQLDRSSWPLLLAAAVVMTAPVVGLFLLVQRRFWPEGRIEK